MLPANRPVISAADYACRGDGRHCGTPHSRPPRCRVTTMLWPVQPRGRNTGRGSAPLPIVPYKPTSSRTARRFPPSGVRRSGVVARRQRARSFGHHVARLDLDLFHHRRGFAPRTPRHAPSLAAAWFDWRSPRPEHRRRAPARFHLRESFGGRAEAPSARRRAGRAGSLRPLATSISVVMIQLRRGATSQGGSAAGT